MHREFEINRALTPSKLYLEVTCSFHDEWPTSLISGRMGGFRSVCVLLHRWQRSGRKRQRRWGGGDGPSAATCHCSPFHSVLSVAGEDLIWLSLYDCVCTAFHTLTKRLSSCLCVVACVCASLYNAVHVSSCLCWEYLVSLYSTCRKGIALAFLHNLISKNYKPILY